MKNKSSDIITIAIAMLVSAYKLLKMNEMHNMDTSSIPYMLVDASSIWRFIATYNGH